VSGRTARGLFEQAGVSLKEKYVIEKVEAERAKVEERGREPPVLPRMSACT
jgi:hypothetical protein